MNVIISTKHIFNTWDEKIAHAYANSLSNLHVDIDELNDIDVNHLSKVLNDHKMTINILDPKFPNVSINNEKDLQDELQRFDELLDKVSSLPIINIIYRLPYFNNVVEDYNKVANHIKNIITKFKKLKLTLLVKPEDRLANVYTYVIKKYNNKQLRLLFDPVFFNKKEALGTTYRQLYDCIDVFILNNIDNKNLLSVSNFGTIRIQELLNRVSKDNQKYYYLINPEYNNYFTKLENYSFFQKMFDFDGNKKRKMIKKFAKEAFDDQNKNITIGDVYQSDINLLKKYKLVV